MNSYILVFTSNEVVKSSLLGDLCLPYKVIGRYEINYKRKRYLELIEISGPITESNIKTYDYKGVNIVKSIFKSTSDVVSFLSRHDYNESFNHLLMIVKRELTIKNIVD